MTFPIVFEINYCVFSWQLIERGWSKKLQFLKSIEWLFICLQVFPYDSFAVRWRQDTKSEERDSTPESLEVTSIVECTLTLELTILTNYLFVILFTCI